MAEIEVRELSPSLSGCCVVSSRRVLRTSKRPEVSFRIPTITVPANGRHTLIDSLAGRTRPDVGGIFLPGRDAKVGKGIVAGFGQ